MYLEGLKRNISDDKLLKIEQNPTFRVFLVKYWVRNFIEYKALFDEKQRSICVEEYIRYMQETNPIIFKNLFN